MREIPRSIIYVSGPRRTGKTTGTRQALAEVGIPYRYCSSDSHEPFPFLGTPLGLDKEIAPLSMTDSSWIVQRWNRSPIDGRTALQSRSNDVRLLALI